MVITTTGGHAVYYNKRVLGACSICGGPVSVPTVWWGVVPPTPTCERCGAYAAPNYGPTIPMVPAPGTTGDQVVVPRITWGPRVTISPSVREGSW